MSMPPAQIVLRSEAQVMGEILRLGDIADLTGLPSALRSRAAAIALPWRITRDGTIDAEAIVAAARSRMPVLACAFGTVSGKLSVHRRPAVDVRPPQGGPPPKDAIARGDQIALDVTVGAVRIKRDVTAIQAALPGQRLFVEDSEGRLLSVRYAGNTQ